MEPVRPLPASLRRLGELAFDLRQTSSKTLAHLWRRLDPQAWDQTGNPYVVLLHAHQDRIDELATDADAIAELERWFERHDALMQGPRWFGSHPARQDLTGVAYFSMEFGLSEALPIYSGGLGILAGDHLKSAADLGVPVVGIG